MPVDQLPVVGDSNVASQIVKQSLDKSARMVGMCPVMARHVLLECYLHSVISQATFFYRWLLDCDGVFDKDFDAVILLLSLLSLSSLSLLLSNGLRSAKA